MFPSSIDERPDKPSLSIFLASFTFNHQMPSLFLSKALASSWHQIFLASSLSSLSHHGLFSLPLPNLVPRCLTDAENVSLDVCHLNNCYSKFLLLPSGDPGVGDCTIDIRSVVACAVRVDRVFVILEIAIHLRNRTWFSGQLF